MVKKVWQSDRHTSINRLLCLVIMKEIITRTCILIPQQLECLVVKWPGGTILCTSLALCLVNPQAQHFRMHNRMVSNHMTTGLKIERIQVSRVNRNQYGPEHILKWVKIMDLHWSLQSRQLNHQQGYRQTAKAMTIPSGRRRPKVKINRSIVEGRARWHIVFEGRK